jgi:hypothetical protein
MICFFIVTHLIRDEDIHAGVDVKVIIPYARVVKVEIFV